jgi:hypothetical protein
MKNKRKSNLLNIAIKQLGYFNGLKIKKKNKKSKDNNYNQKSKPSKEKLSTIIKDWIEEKLNSLKEELMNMLTI